MIRRIVAAIAAVVFFAGFAFAMNRLGLAVWPAYAEAFALRGLTTGMLFARLATAVVLLLGSGFLAARIARGDRIAVMIAAGVLLLLGCSSHLNEPVWSHFPLWYHIAFLGLIAPCVLIGGRLKPRSAD
jgi:hypothetical protein